MRIPFPNILLLAGTGRNVGKTAFAEQIIHKTAAEMHVWGLKISNHYHPGEVPALRIQEEHVLTSHKDSSRMLRAGAEKVFYIQAQDADLPQLMNDFLTQLPADIAVVCEAGGLISFIEPSLFLLIHSPDVPTSDEKMSRYANYHPLRVDFAAGRFSLNPHQIHFLEGSWRVLSGNNRG